ncbi:DUF3298 domain-containing protein [Granulicella sp. WH15]|uniref:DUF3298 domain-containing protein n=1 Tax=Granulicella sp. WH15 TaxID=2602070 RepID=UPI0013A5AF57|nr:DUF3298 domain-containing protein [Granulicella sp. WH15]
MRLSARFVVMILAVLSAAPAVAAGFDCAKATTPREKTVCADPELSKLDEDVAAAYKALRSQLSPASAARVQQDQRAWLRWLDASCPDLKDKERPIGGCLGNAYPRQLQMLQKQPQRVGGMTFFPRLRMAIAPNTQTPAPGSFYPSFGVGRFSWPEIDQPTPEQAAWNAAVRSEAVRLGSGTRPRQRTPSDFRTAFVADSEVDVGYVLKAANESLISVVMGKSIYEYGAAHPNEDVIPVQWWLRLKRPLKGDDIFKTGSGWEQFLGKRCYEVLKSGEQAQYLYDDKTVREATMSSVKQMNNWTLDAQGFQVNFPEYGVAPRVVGEVSARIRWEELKPYLAPGFRPADLPQPR